MNWNLVQSTYFLIAIVVLAWGFAMLPFVRNMFGGISDSYVRSQMNQIQAEMVFMDRVEKGGFDRMCHFGRVGQIVNALVEENSGYTSCRTNKPENTEMIVCSGLRDQSYYCVDSRGVVCNLYQVPKNGYQCKNLTSLLIFSS